VSINRAKREAVYRKYDGRCAYCGRQIAYKDMQVDHFIPQEMEPVVVAGNFPGIDNIDDFQNLMPSCRMCNHYKRAHSLETFRRYIEDIPRKLRNDYIYKIGIVYGLVIENEHPVTFYFENHSPKEET
jgi:5-methylcytosine-specific restriction endonuclease McrA